MTRQIAYTTSYRGSRIYALPGGNWWERDVQRAMAEIFYQYLPEDMKFLALQYGDLPKKSLSGPDAATLLQACGENADAVVAALSLILKHEPSGKGPYHRR